MNSLPGPNCVAKNPRAERTDRRSANPPSRSCQSLTTTRYHGWVHENISMPRSRTRVPEMHSWIAPAPSTKKMRE